MTFQESEVFHTYYDRSWRVWVAYKIDHDNNQIGRCGYGTSINDAQEDCCYQNKVHA